MTIRKRKKSDFRIDDLGKAVAAAKRLCIPRTGEIGGLIRLTGLLELPNLLDGDFYLGDFAAGRRRIPRGEPILGCWHTHRNTSRPSAEDYRQMREIWEWGGVFSLIVTPRPIYVLTGQDGHLARIITR